MSAQIENKREDAQSSSPQPIRIVLCQVNAVVGGVQKNVDHILSTAQAIDQSELNTLLVFPELVLTGYPPEDLLLRPQFIEEVEQGLVQLAKDLAYPSLLGAPVLENGVLFNAAYLLRDGRVELVYKKQCLPNYGVFDEKRYFSEAAETSVVMFEGHKLGVLICEDLWHQEPAMECKKAGASMLLGLNASPYHRGKYQQRIAEMKDRVAETDLPLAYVNLQGGQDEVVFDGGSFAINNDTVYSDVRFKESWFELSFDGQLLKPLNSVASPINDLQEVYEALVLATRDYVNKNGFKGVVLGLSGGIDSALTLAVAVDALGADRVEAIMMPSRYTSDMSLEDAQLIADNFGVAYHIAEIEQPFQASLQVLNPMFEGKPVDTTEENMQARIRGMMVMAVSNKKGLMVLTTGNKSEYAVGYSTLYGDMVGGYAPLKDVSKTLVFELSRWRNTSEQGEMIPDRIITRPPSAELAPDQKDEDSLPPYDVLDQILECYVEKRQSAEEIIAAGFDRQQVKDTIWRVNINEYKRRQSAPGVKITNYAFGRERRYPITSGFDR